MPARKSKATYRIQTVTNALRVLDAFRHADEYGVTELARKLELHKNNAFRLLASLQQMGFVEQTADERYQLGLRALQIGQAFLRGRPLLRRARPYLEGLATRSQESAHLASLKVEPRGFAVVFLDGVASDALVHTSTRLGLRLPAHCTAVGKAMLGCSPPELREQFDRALAAGSALPGRTPESIVDVHKLTEHLRTVGLERFAIDVEECERGLVCAAAPVLGPAGEIVAGLSISGPVFRLGRDRLVEEMVPLVTDAAERLSRDLGYSA